MLIALFVSLNVILILSLTLLMPLYFYPAMVLAFVSAAGLIVLLHRTLNNQGETLDSVREGLMHLLDGNLSISLSEGDLQGKNLQIIQLFNQTADKVRREKVNIYQRELMLDKVVNQSNILTILVNVEGKVVYANLPAVHFFAPAADLLGNQWDPVLEQTMPAFHESLKTNGNAICSFEDQEHRLQSWHLSQSELKLQGSPHKLFLFKPITEELNQQELETWKKAIRVISHELNNSLAPISSLCHSGKLLAEKHQSQQLDRAFNGISKRVNHLAEFVKGYSKLAKLNQPQTQSIELADTLQGIQMLYPFTLEAEHQDYNVNADKAQLEQALINVIKNASEAATSSDNVIARLQQNSQRVQIIVEDDGPGIPEQNIHQVLLPFYSTKADGTGVGLAICRNVVDAHKGKLSLKNKAEGGLQVIIELPRENS